MRFFSALGSATRLTPGDLGRAGEKRGVWFYRWRGYRIVARNLRASEGEIDLVVSRGKTLVFVEIKTRQTRDRGAPWEAVNRSKQLRIARLAERFMASSGTEFGLVRFDVLSLVWNGRRFEIEWFPGAFELKAAPSRPWRVQ